MHLGVYACAVEKPLFSVRAVEKPQKFIERNNVGSNKMRNKDMEKQLLKEREAKVIEFAAAFCNEHLNEECAGLCTKLIQELGRKRSCPLQSGKEENWAAGAVYTICSINLLFSKKYQVKVSPTDISDYFGASVSTISQKMRDIKGLLKIDPVFDTKYKLKEVLQHNPPDRLRMIADLFSMIKRKK